MQIQQPGEDGLTMKLLYIHVDPIQSEPAVLSGDERKRNFRRFLHLGHVATAPGQEHVAISRSQTDWSPNEGMSNFCLRAIFMSQRTLVLYECLRENSGSKSYQMDLVGFAISRCLLR